MNTKWMGLWAQDRPAFYAGQVIAKKDIPKYTRIVLRYNKFYESGSNKPRFVYCFADSESYKDKCVPVELEKHERLYTHEEVLHAINAAYADGTGNDGSYGNVRVEDYIR